MGTLFVRAAALSPLTFSLPVWAALVYVPNAGSGTVSVIDSASSRVVQTIAVCKLPWGAAIR